LELRAEGGRIMVSFLSYGMKNGSIHRLTKLLGVLVLLRILVIGKLIK